PHINEFSTIPNCLRAYAARLEFICKITEYMARWIAEWGSKPELDFLDWIEGTTGEPNYLHATNLLNAALEVHGGNPVFFNSDSLRRSHKSSKRRSPNPLPHG